ncbi:MAG: PP2C family protein-serine/threonine phosphatase [Syntrophothermus sp.]
MAAVNRLKKLFDFYVSDLNYEEFDRLIKREVPEVYDFYVRRMKRPDLRHNPLRRALYFIWYLIVEFLERLTPLRRLFYSVAVFFFFWGNITVQWNYAFLGFFMLNLMLAFEVADKLTARDELAVARDIQTSLMPAEPPKSKYYDIASYYETAKEVGGDYLDFLQLDNSEEGRLYVIVGDISGKGMGAALRMVQVQAVLKYLICSCHTPRSILIELNKNIRQILRPDNFFTVTVAALDCDGQIHLSRAGHPPMFHYVAQKKAVIPVTPAGMGIGLKDNGMFDKVIDQVTITAAEDDVFVLFTDGVIETMNERKDLFGEEKLKSILIKYADQPAARIKEHILASLTYFRGSDIPEDDLSFVVLKAKRQGKVTSDDQNMSVQSK